MLIGIKYRSKRTTPYQRKFRYYFQYLLSVIVITSLISGCAIISRPHDKVFQNQTWTDSLLRRIDPVNSSNPSTDVLAIFSDWQTDKFLVRLDFLDTPDESTLINLDFFQANLSSCDPQKCLSLGFQFSLGFSSNNYIQLSEPRY